MKKIKAPKPHFKKYQKAFKKFAKCKEDDFEIMEHSLYKGIFIKDHNSVYRVASYKETYDKIKEALIEPGLAINIPLYEWIDVAEDVHLKTEFIDKLIPKLGKREQIQDLCMALTISTHTERFKDFWVTIYDTLDSLELYGEAIVTACQVYNLEDMCDELLSYLIANGREYFNQLQGGVFEEVELSSKDDEVGENNEDNADDIELYYIYAVDPSIWTDHD